MTSFKTTFGTNYSISTKANLKCFPRCGETHMDKTFCGRGVEVVLTSKPGICLEKLIIYGEIKDVSKNILQKGESLDHDISKYFPGKFSFYESDGSGYCFLFPKGKWRSPEDIKGKEFHFVCYVVIDNVVIETAVSTTFSISGIVHKKRQSKQELLPEKKRARKMEDYSQSSSSEGEQENEQDSSMKQFSGRLLNLSREIPMRSLATAKVQAPLFPQHHLLQSSTMFSYAKPGIAYTRPFRFFQPVQFVSMYSQAPLSYYPLPVKRSVF